MVTSVYRRSRVRDVWLWCGDRRRRNIARVCASIVCIFILPSSGFAQAVGNQCPVPARQAIAPQFSTDIDIPAGSTEVRADSVSMVDGGVSEFVGNVEVVRDSQQLIAERVTWDEASDLVTFATNARLHSGAFLWRGEIGQLRLDIDRADLEVGRYWLTDGLAHGRADSITRDGVNDISILTGVDYSTCLGETPDWRLSGGKITLNHATDRGSARNIVLRAREIPIFYFPYLTFPLNNDRKSGFLAPTLRSSSESGLDIRVPFYWNIAPNFDATITPRTLTDRGGMLESEFRYLFTQGRGEVRFEALPQDDLFEDRSRGLLVFRHDQRIANGRGYLRADINQVSDEQYFEDLGNSLGVTSTRFLRRDLEAYYSGNRWSVLGRIQNYQTVDPSLAAEFRPYRRLPQVFFNYVSSTQNNRLVAGVVADATYFQRSNSVIGGRVHVEPRLSYPLRDAGRFLIPTLTVKHTQYFLEDNSEPTASLGSFDNRLDRTVPTFTLDAGLIAERRFAAFGERLLQTLEPRAYYLYVPETGQDDLPVFDSSEYDFTFQNLFRNNRFSGYDRIGDANQLTLALTSRLLNRDTGAERLRISLGQIYYFRDREVTLPNADVADDGVSEFLGEVSAEIASGWRARATVQWDPNDSQTEKLAFTVNYRPDNGAVLNAGYRFRRALSDVEQTDISFLYPVNEKWSLVGRWNYSLQQERTLELVGGVEYESCCWGVRIGGRRFIRNTEGEFDNAFFVQFQFKGLAGIGSNTLTFLQNQIPGYYPRF